METRIQRRDVDSLAFFSPDVIFLYLSVFLTSRKAVFPPSPSPSPSSSPVRVSPKESFDIHVVGRLGRSESLPTFYRCTRLQLSLTNGKMGVELQGNGPGEPPMNPALAVPLFVVGGFVAVLFFWRTIIRIRHHRRSKLAQQVDDQAQLSQTSNLNASLKKHVFYAPACGARHSREFRLFRLHMGTIPLRLEMILLVIYLLMNFIFVVVMVDWWKDFSDKMFQLKYAAGHLAVMNTPGLVLSAGRNNPLVQMLGLPFDTFNLMHRWVGRVVAANAVVHMSAVLANQAYMRTYDRTR